MGYHIGDMPDDGHHDGWMSVSKKINHVEVDIEKIGAGSSGLFRSHFSPCEAQDSRLRPLAHMECRMPICAPRIDSGTSCPADNRLLPKSYVQTAVRESIPGLWVAIYN
jgi:hypothetical protein